MTGSNDKKVSKPINSDTSEYQRTHYGENYKDIPYYSDSPAFKYALRKFQLAVDYDDEKQNQLKSYLSGTPLYSITTHDESGNTVEYNTIKLAVIYFEYYYDKDLADLIWKFEEVCAGLFQLTISTTGIDNVLCILELNELYSERGMSPLKVNNKKVVEMLNENFRSGSWARVKNKERLENIKIVLNKHRDFLDRYGFDPKFYKTV